MVACAMVLNPKLIDLPTPGEPAQLSSRIDDNPGDDIERIAGSPVDDLHHEPSVAALRQRPPGIRRERRGCVQESDRGDRRETPSPGRSNDTSMTSRPAWRRVPSTRTAPARRTASRTPSRSSPATAPGERNSPQTFSRGNRSRANATASIPFSERTRAQAAPARLPPTTTTVLSFISLPPGPTGTESSGRRVLERLPGGRCAPSRGSGTLGGPRSVHRCGPWRSG